jgi:methyl-accepting chemotaxis protein
MLVPDIEKTTQLIKEISAASIEQKTGAEQINMAMQQLNMITQENASSSDMLTQSSNQLAILANNLKEAVGIFNVGEEYKETSVPQKAGSDISQPKSTMQTNKSRRPTKPSSDLGSDITGLGREFDLDNYEKF